jgi:hypothetical protein
MPPALKARMFAAFDLSILWIKAGSQATVSITITDASLTALTDILDPDQPGYHDTHNAAPASPAPVRQLTRPAITGPLPQSSGPNAGVPQRATTITHRFAGLSRLFHSLTLMMRLVTLTLRGEEDT